MITLSPPPYTSHTNGIIFTSLAVIFLLLLLLTPPAQSYSREHRVVSLNHDFNYANESLYLELSYIDLVLDDISIAVRKSLSEYEVISKDEAWLEENSGKISSVIIKDVFNQLWNTMKTFAAEEDVNVQRQRNNWLELADTSSRAKYESSRVNLTLINTIMNTADSESVKNSTFFDLAAAFVEVMFNKEQFETVDYFLNNLLKEGKGNYVDYLDLEDNKIALVRLLNVWFELSRVQGKFVKSVVLGLMLILKSDHDKTAQTAYKLRLLFLTPPSLLYDEAAFQKKTEVLEDLIRLREKASTILTGSAKNSTLDDFPVLFPTTLTFNLAHQASFDRALYVELNKMLSLMFPDLNSFICDNMGEKVEGTSNSKYLKYSDKKENSFLFLEPSSLISLQKQKMEKRRVVNIGFISGYFYDHSVGRILLDTLAMLKKLSDVERGPTTRIPFDLNIIVYFQDENLSKESYFQLKSQQDKTNSTAIRIHNQQSRPNDYILAQYQKILGSSFVHLPDDIDIIRTELCKDNLDVLVFADIGLKMSTYALATFRLAIHQVVFWGHPVTSGISNTIDYFFSLDTETIDASNDYEEQLVRMSVMNTVPYSKYRPSNVLDRDSFLEKVGISSKSKYLAVLGRFHKLHPTFEDIIVALLFKIYENSIRQSQYYVIFVAEAVQERNIYLLARLKDRIIESGLPVELVNQIRFVDYSNYPSIVSHAAAVLDTFPYGGCLSTFDAISNAIPVVTLPSQIPGGRFTYSLYLQMEHRDLIAKSEITYVELSYRLLSDHDFRQEQSIEIETKYEKHKKDNYNFRSLDEWITFLKKLILF